MDANEFRQKHEKWQDDKTGKRTNRKQEQPGTWLISKSGCYFPLKGDLDHELERLRKMDMACNVFHNVTSHQMRDKQNEIRARRDNG